MHEKTDRRCFLARGVLGAAGIGAACSSIEENILLGVEPSRLGLWLLRLCPRIQRPRKKPPSRLTPLTA